MRTPSGSCVNTLIDFNNCGSIGFVCSVIYTSCSYGTCSTAPAVILQGGVNPSSWGGSLSVDDAFININIPFSITLYGVSTTTPAIQTNGVNIFLAADHIVLLSIDGISSLSNTTC